MTFTLDRFDLDAFVASTLAEDLGEIGDITSAAVIPADAMFSGVMDRRDDVVVAGLPLAEAFLRSLDPDVEIDALVRDGDQLTAGTDVIHLQGQSQAVLPGEQSTLISVQQLTEIEKQTSR